MDLYSASEQTPLTRSDMDHTVLPANNTISAFTPSRRASPPFGRYTLCLPTEGWPGWVDTGCWVDLHLPARRRESELNRVIIMCTNCLFLKLCVMLCCLIVCCSLSLCLSYCLIGLINVFNNSDESQSVNNSSWWDNDWTITVTVFGFSWSLWHFLSMAPQTW